MKRSAEIFGRACQQIPKVLQNVSVGAAPSITRAAEAAGNGPQSDHGRSRLWSPDSALIDGLRGSGAKFRLANGAIATRLALPVANPAQRWQGYAVRPISRSFIGQSSVRKSPSRTMARTSPSMKNTNGLASSSMTVLTKRFTVRQSSSKHRSICFSRSSSS